MVQDEYKGTFSQRFNIYTQKGIKIGSLSNKCGEVVAPFLDALEVEALIIKRCWNLSPTTHYTKCDMQFGRIPKASYEMFCK